MGINLRKSAPDLSILKEVLLECTSSSFIYYNLRLKHIDQLFYFCIIEGGQTFLPLNIILHVDCVLICLVCGACCLLKLVMIVCFEIFHPPMFYLLVLYFLICVWVHF
jgi:hypothetical protein